jgi:uncharacterized membrane protein
MMAVARDRPSADTTRTRRGPELALPGTVLGVGLGGFVDGIVLHQVLQWHHMLSSTDTARIDVPAHSPETVAGLQVNVLWDGLFHVGTWFAVVLGVVLLVTRIRRHPGRTFRQRLLWGWVLVGWGVFNLVEGVINHHVLGIHHVRSGPYQTWWDLGFLAFGALLVVGGWLLQRSGHPPVEQPGVEVGGAG